MLLVPGLMTFWPGEKGIRCDTGAVPAAVSPSAVFRPLLVTVPFLRDGKTSENRASQKTCHRHEPLLSG